MEITIKRDPRGQGDQGERSAIIWLLEQGFPVFLPIGHSPDIDLVTVIDNRCVGVQVKTSTQFRNRRWEITVCTRGGNQSWNGVVKLLDPSRYDYLFVLVADGRRWFMPSSVVGGGSGIHLGGPKYAKYEIEPGQPLRSGSVPLDSAGPWRGSRAVKGTRL
jgi:hypothetical protein